MLCAEWGLVVDVILGIAGALVGGFLFRLSGLTGVTGFNLWSVFVSMTGAIFVLVVSRAFAAPRSV